MTKGSSQLVVFFLLLMMHRSFLPVLTVFVAISSASAQGTDSTSKGKSVLQGVYTEEQATRGDGEQQSNCSACHGTENYSGAAFAKAWIGRTAFDLFDQLKTTMPEDNPGGLSAQQYTDVIAYIFKINGFPAGTEPLSTDPEVLRLIKIEAKPDKQTALGPRSMRIRPMFRPHVPASPSAKR